MGNIDLWYMIRESSLMIQGVLLVLFAMSVTSWALIFCKYIQLRRVKEKTIAAAKDMYRFEDVENALGAMKPEEGSPVYQLTLVGLQELRILQGLQRPTAVDEELRIRSIRQTLREEVGEQIGRLFGPLGLLAACANAAPLLGLFGTVWGIMDSFHSFKGLHSSSLAEVAPGLAEALVTTAFGLVVAIPTTLAYNYFMRQLQLIESTLNNLTYTLSRLIAKSLCLSANAADSA